MLRTDVLFKKTNNKAKEERARERENNDTQNIYT